MSEQATAPVSTPEATDPNKDALLRTGMGALMANKGAVDSAVAELTNSQDPEVQGILRQLLAVQQMQAELERIAPALAGAGVTPEGAGAGVITGAGGAGAMATKDGQAVAGATTTDGTTVAVAGGDANNVGAMAASTPVTDDKAAALIKELGIKQATGGRTP